MSKVGRNEPCPCGSGKKYKRCCLRQEETPPATDIRTVDGVVTPLVSAWVLDEHVERADALRPLAPESLWESEEAESFITSLLAYETTAPDGSRLCQEIPERALRILDPRERQWLGEQVQGWFSLWDVIEVRRGEGLFLRDLFTWEERFVREVRATHYVQDRSILLARVVRLGQTWTLQAVHPYHLQPAAGDRVATEARRMLKLGRGKVDPERLRGEAAFRLAGLWEEAVQQGLRAPRPRLQNTDGDPLVPTRDVHAFDPAQRDDLVSRLLELPDVEREDAETARASEVLAVFREEGEQMTLLARLIFGEDGLAVETNSTRRADGMRAKLEEHLAGRLRFQERTESDPWELLDQAGSLEDEAEEPDVPSEEAAQIVLAYKEKHYATWPDTPLPALGNITPRDAARDKRRRVYRQLDVVLRDIEHGESMQPFEQRYDVGILRRELGM